MIALVHEIDQAGIWCRAGSEIFELEESAQSSSLDAVLLDLAAVGIGAQAVVEQVSQLQLPTLLVLDHSALEQYDPRESRKWFFARNGHAVEQLIRVGELTIDLQSYEVNMGGRRVSLTYKEFQLLTLLASNPGRVYTREALLNQVWGYDYLGGTRTVDVHIRRLRSKIEDPDHLFVETIWNVGYRFRDMDNAA
ncbi:Transcriptional regulatory protein GlnR [Geodia barretti]|uniref:Transcriptional regulatory protein GlnR n=1 Tax=Geodia barretti TaxID=519541 RepID=A0AA35TCW9_GEOBA|nr:Transcriptional regulatory protein GlnR [Geodia barretti]